jgi:hypothetical protein
VLLGVRDVNCQSTLTPVFRLLCCLVGGADCSVDLETGVKDPHQPYKTLSKYRRVDAGAKYSPCFGMLCVSDAFGIPS